MVVVVAGVGGRVGRWGGVRWSGEKSGGVRVVVVFVGVRWWRRNSRATAPLNPPSTLTRHEPNLAA